MDEEAKEPLTLSFVIGSNQALPWLENVILTLSVGQTATLAPVEIDDVSSVKVTLDKMTPPHTATTTDTEDNPFCQSPQTLRDKGNQIVKTANDHKEYRQAFLHYYRALQLGPIDGKLATAIHANLSLVALRTQDWGLALVHADAAQLYSSAEGQSQSAKVCFRRASAYVEFNQMLPALAQFNRAYQICPTDPIVAKDRKQAHESVTKLLSKGRSRFAEIYNIMLQSPIFDNPLLIDPS